jgi:hypothetical protein
MPNTRGACSVPVMNALNGVPNEKLKAVLLQRRGLTQNARAGFDRRIAPNPESPVRGLQGSIEIGG